MVYMNKKIFSLIALIPLLGIGLFYLGKKKPEKEPILAILQTGPQKEALTTNYLAQIMDLSVDEPTLFHQFSPDVAKEKLLASPFITKAEVELIKPNTVFVDYSIRMPLATLYDYENIALDEKGHLFPMFPFISPRNLSEIYLGSDTIDYTTSLEGENFTLARETLTFLQKEDVFSHFTIKRVDVSKAFIESYGKRELVVILESARFSSENIKKTFTYFLRLSPDKYIANFEKFISLYHAHLKEKEMHIVEPVPLVIDLRLEELAFIH